MSSGEAKALADIEKYGCHVLQVAAEGDLPPFSYSIGIERSCGAPEIIVVGLKEPIALFVVNEYNRLVRVGQRFEHGTAAAGFIDGFEVQFRRVHQTQYREYLGWAIWLYRGTDFRVLQMVYPTTAGLWPWDEAASDWFRSRQVLLDQPAPPEPR